VSDEESIIQACLKLLDDFKGKLLEVQPTDFQEYVNNYLIHKTAERLLETAIEACLDIGRHLIAKEGFRYPEDNKEVFRVLAEEKVISADLLARLEDMAKFRNMLIHGYARIDHSKVYAILQTDLGDFDEFARAIVAYLSRPVVDEGQAVRERRATYAARRKRPATK
jgi:uncharacterized protein YutE (UPF0331/DUF86 family)